MPLYQYQCRSCETSFEVKRSYVQADLPAVCPACGSQETKKQLTAVAAFVGSRSDSIPLSLSNGGGCGCGGHCACHN